VGAGGRVDWNWEPEGCEGEGQGEGMDVDVDVNVGDSGGVFVSSVPPFPLFVVFLWRGANCVV
jgi:hypothetical protein